MSLANSSALPAHPPVRVLIVDDDTQHRKLERELLDSPGYQVSECESGTEALEWLRHHETDVVLLDKRMPGMDGDETCRRIRGELGLALLPVLMVTGSNDIANLTDSLGVGATDFIRKPYHPAELIARVDAAAAQKRLTDQLDSAESLLFSLARMVEAKDGTTGDHCTRLSHTSVVLGRALGLSAEELLALRRGGVLHDIGKLGIPESILLKPGKLTQEEWRLMQQHVHIGACIVGELKSMRLTAPIILHHHERWDGTGYPHALAGRDIPLLARIFQTVDIYDALTHARPYKPAMVREQVIATMREEMQRGWRDPEITSLFLEIAENQPELLEPPPADQEDLGCRLFGEIQATGAIEWCRRELP
ncbi:HD domain-containing phosphohydrolase [uncultured Herbaspirillum sp.]|uniref:response regulator n=1 Tax=uncultured Herbaspirillum sp. TaxID=160236 RepID=UPI0026209877|nr:HD domain-containing phosphohydrolase [uncultured Herbaspirillum sp.]